MRLPALRRRPVVTEIGGVVRLDRRTKDLTKRLNPGEIAVINHSDLDRVSAEALVATQVSAVVNAVPSTSGRYPNLGPGILLQAGIPLIDDAGLEVFTELSEGDRVTLDGGNLLDPTGAVVAGGTLMTVDLLETKMEAARAGLSDQIDAFADNTMQYLKLEKELLLEGVGVPDVRTQIEGRHVLIVVRGYDYRSDLDALRPYISEYKPLLMGVDGGADALIEAGYKPDMILGDMDSVSDATLRCGAELVVHAYRDGRAPGLDRVEKLGLTGVVFPALGTSEDAAMLLADSKGARLLVAVGTHASLVEFLDKGREGMASTFLTRLRVGPKLVDAKGVSRIYRSQIKGWHLLLLVLSGLLALTLAMTFTDLGGALGSVVIARIRDLAYWIKESSPDDTEKLPRTHPVESRTLINFRYHIVSLMAVFLALSVGIVLGVTLRGPVDTGLTQQAETDRKQVTDLRAQLDRRDALDDYREAWAERGGKELTKDTLTDQRVAVVVMPNSPAPVVNAIQTAITDAGGTVTHVVRVDADVFDTTKADAVTKALASFDQQLDVNDDTPTGTRVGRAVSRAFLGKQPVERDGSAADLTDALTGAGLVTVAGRSTQLAQLAVVVSSEAATPAYLPEVLEDHVRMELALKQNGAGVVVAGPNSEEIQGTDVLAVRNSADATDAVSTVDVADLDSGVMTTVLAGREQLLGRQGHYGALSKADQPMPQLPVR